MPKALISHNKPFITEDLDAPALHYHPGDAELHVQVQVVDQAKQGQSWAGWLWDTADLSRQERRLLFKVDVSLLIFASVRLFFPSESPC